MDLRETRHWSYGANGRFQTTVEAAPYVISAPVQADQTGPSLASARTDVVEFLTKQPMTQEEFDRAIKGGINALPGSYETSGAVLVAMQSNDTYRRPDDYQMTLATRLRGYTLADLNGAIRGAIDPNKAFWVVVGDAAKVKPQLDTLGLPVEVIPANAVAGAPAGGAPVAK